MATSRNWIDHEEDVLLTILEEMIADGVRCEIGSFKAGTFKHPNASCKPNKPFPLYPRLCTVFGRDRATGSIVESAPDAIENMCLESEDCETSEMPPHSPTPSPSVATSSASQPVRKKKRSRNDGDANIVSVINEGWNKAVTEMKKLGESFTFREAKARLPFELQAIGLPYDQVLRISMKLVKDIDLMGIWTTLDDSQKPDFIKVFMESL
ncbi:hypothetical protein C1H46_016880 [Malus baccata]|uniref:Myb/SANT-like domain-containing protein n=1 Tax=Malus baccata TaxID=106549 RepID=A0A540MGG1_MALBA|nr:hypothetical protein C1H46_016880 [Malus baccata]